MCSLRGNATEWETATGNNSFFHRALAGTGHFSAEFAAIVIMSRLRADKLIQKCRLSEGRPICQFYWNTFIERIFQCALPKVHSFSLFRNKPEKQGEVHTLLFKSSTFFSQNIFFQTFSHSSRVLSRSLFSTSLTVLSKLSSFSGPCSAELQSVSNFYSSRVPPPWSLNFVHFFDFSHWLGPRGTVLMF